MDLEYRRALAAQELDRGRTTPLKAMIAIDLWDCAAWREVLDVYIANNGSMPVPMPDNMVDWLRLGRDFFATAVEKTPLVAGLRGGDHRANWGAVQLPPFTLTEMFTLLSAGAMGARMLGEFSASSIRYRFGHNRIAAAIEPQFPTIAEFLIEAHDPARDRVYEPAAKPGGGKRRGGM
jgi:hypothetical protein